jgi:hypothetical protein
MTKRKAKPQPPLGTSMAAPRTICPASSKAPYDSQRDQQCQVMRPNATVAMTLPSRWGAQLRYPNGTVQHFAQGANHV